jgi:hypothetical protein
LNLSPRERRLLMLLVPAVLIFVVPRFTVLSDSGPAAPASDGNSVALAQQRVARLRQLKALVPSREAVMKQAESDLAIREKGMIPGDTAAQAQAALLEAARRVGKSNQLDIRGGDFPAPKAFGDYGLVFTSLSFECHVEQLVNYLADLGRQPELMVPSEERITAGQDKKQKIVSVRMVLAGVVSKKLIPEKKGLGAF